MNCWELMVVILTLGFVTMIETCVISVCIGKVLDQRLKVRAAVGHKILKAEMDEIKTCIKECLEMFIPKEQKNKMSEPNTHCGYNNYKVVKPIKVEEKEPEELDEDIEDWLK